MKGAIYRRRKEVWLTRLAVDLVKPQRGAEESRRSFSVLALALERLDAMLSRGQEIDLDARPRFASNDGPGGDARRSS